MFVFPHFLHRTAKCKKTESSGEKGKKQRSYHNEKSSGWKARKRTKEEKKQEAVMNSLSTEGQKLFSRMKGHIEM